ncbi:MAG: LCP family protein, partial [Agathobacter sp.]|nr:LCP family protein [Agathobacter sp.]
MDTETENKKEKRKKTKKKKSLGRIILMIIGFVLLFAVTVALTIGFLTIRPPDVSGKNTNSDKTTQVEERTDGRYSVLVVGTDDAGLNTDTILVASLDSKHNTASVMSIPRDTMSNVTRNVKKINAAYAAGAKDGVGNIDNLKKEISYLVGFPVDNYVVIDLTAFEELIDALGGVTIDVPRNMHYDDPYQDLHIHIDKGLQTLNGKDAIGFVRFRSDYAEGDLGRVKAQQMFIEALAKQVATPATVTKLPQLTDIVLDNMRTDLTYGELVWFVKEAVSVDMSTNLHMFTLPGIAETVKPNGSYQALSYYLPYEDEILEIVNAYFNPYSKDLVDLNVVDTEALLAQAGKQRAEREQQKEETENAEG